METGKIKFLLCFKYKKRKGQLYKNELKMQPTVIDRKCRIVTRSSPVRKETNCKHVNILQLNNYHSDTE